MSVSILTADRVAPVPDAFGRPLRSLRISVTDRCNLRCQYCMPEEEYLWLERCEILSFEEITELAGVFASLGVDQFRLTGGEPLLRHGLDGLVRMLKAANRVRDLAVTTNGILLASSARVLREAGLDRVTVSLDTLQPERFRSLTRRNTHADVLRGITSAREAGFGRLKINTVVIRGFNDDELGALVRFGRDAGAEVRFIEYMDVGGAQRWSMNQVVTREEILARLEQQFGPIRPVEKASAEAVAAPADRFLLSDGTVFGIIASTTAPFCGSCDRARLTPDGMFLLCLYARAGVDLKAALRRGASHQELAATIADSWRARTDRGAEERKALGARGVLFQIADLRQDPHLEMHTRGG
ncbi:MAG TPA: GTP 3',8-cyclase MoaA [Terriglobia bacterium]|nr:GTP 3',8-cyclase MoaA [Terriglobia bacterium]